MFSTYRGGSDRTKAAAIWFIRTGVMSHSSRPKSARSIYRYTNNLRFHGRHRTSEPPRSHDDADGNIFNGVDVTERCLNRTHCRQPVITFVIYDGFNIVIIKLRRYNIITQRSSSSSSRIAFPSENSPG